MNHADMDSALSRPTECPFVNRLVVDLLALAEDRSLTTLEILRTNDFYGHATVLKSFAELPANSPLHLSIEHGPVLDHTIWEHNFHKDFTLSLVAAQWRADYLGLHLRKKIVPIGPYVHYARPLLTFDELNTCREQLGPTLLVFPMHSTHHINVEYDIGAFCRRIREVRGDFRTVLVCLYWKDVLRGVHKDYAQHGLPCITAGHIYDHDFMRRLRTYLEIADASLSNALGSHLGYSIYLGKPHQLVRQDYVLQSESAERLAETGAGFEEARYMELFSSPSSQITAEQRALVGRYWGFEDVKSVSQIRQLVEDGARLHATANRWKLMRRMAGPLARLIPKSIG